MKHLMDDPPLVVSPKLATLIGINPAHILQQLHFLLQVTEKNETNYNFVDGFWWVYNSYADWKRKYFPWLSTDAIQRIFLDLEAEGIVRSRQSVKSPGDRTKWYRIDDQGWDEWISSHIMAKDHDGDHGKMPSSIMAKCHDDSTETPTETPIEKKIAEPSAQGENSDEPVLGVQRVTVTGFKGGSPNEEVTERSLLEVRISTMHNPPVALAKKWVKEIKSEIALYQSDPVYRLFMDDFLKKQFYTAKDGSIRLPFSREIMIPSLKMHSDTNWDSYRKKYAPQDASEVQAGDLDDKIFDIGF